VPELSSAERPKVLASFWQIFVEKFDDNSMFLIACFTWLTDLDVHPALDVLFVEGWHRSKTIFELDNFFRVEARVLLESV
jgi:hypothetical protein